MDVTGDSDSNVSEHGANAAETHMVRTRFPDYVMQRMLGNDASALYPEVSEHIRTCSVCRAELDELIEYVDATADDEIPPAPSCSQPDLSFLRPARPLSVPSQMSLQALVIDTLDRIIISFSQALANTIHQPVPVSQFRGGAQGDWLYRYHVERASATQHINVTVDVATEDRARKQARVRVGVEMLTKDVFNQGGSSVILRIAGTSLHGETDEIGFVVFTPVPMEAVGDMQVEIRPGALPEG
ncbi:MAG: hypothetical protein H0X37_10275 [Herpetosiphonaceae bacterium]|nr:hypothetical protein [Herpetosiphonaceae bacterium]